MIFYQGQVEYFGKKEMIILGSMEVRWEESSDVSHSQVFNYSFVDFVIKGYYGQDNIQLDAIYQKLNQIVKETNPSVKENLYPE